MYAKCGSLVDAQLVFEGISCRNQVSWNVLILGYVENGEPESALALFSRMQDEGCVPNTRTFVAALKACASLATREQGASFSEKLFKLRSLEKGMAVHLQAQKSGSDGHIFVQNMLVDMYAKCGSLLDCRRVFDRMAYHSVVSWNALILGYVDYGEAEIALELFACMLPQGFEPDGRSFLGALKAVTLLAGKEEAKMVDGSMMKVVSLEKGLAVHLQAVEYGYLSDVFVASTLVDMYTKCGSLEKARKVFDTMLQRDVVSWTALILGHAANGEGELCLDLFSAMQREGCMPKAATFVAALKGCIGIAAKEEATEVDGKLLKIQALEKTMTVHSQAARDKGCELHISIANTLIGAYAKCGSLVDAFNVFNKMSQRDVVSWTVLMLGLVENGEAELAIDAFARMQLENCSPDTQAFVAALKACSAMAVKDEGRDLNGKLVKVRPLAKGRAIHSQARSDGFDTSMFITNILVSMYAKCGSMVEARQVFEKMPNRSQVAWNALILGYAETGDAEAALELYGIMKAEGCPVDESTFLALLKACATVASLQAGKRIHADICRCNLEATPTLQASLVDLYGKGGCMINAQQVFDSILNADLVVWNALIAGYSRQGNSERVFELFHGMKDEAVNADCITFVSLLTVCSHAGLVDKGKKYLEAMRIEHGVNPSTEHYHCMVDMLGRANRLEEAVSVVKSMPGRPEVSWTAVLGACQKWTNPEVGKLAFDALISLNEKEAAAYILMANITGNQNR